MKISEYLKIVNVFRWSMDKEKIGKNDITDIVGNKEDLTVNDIDLLLSYKDSTIKENVLKYI